MKGVRRIGGPRRHRQVAGWLLGFLFVLVSGACSDTPSQAFRFGLASAPLNLDPRYATDATSARINRLLYRRLVDFDETFRPVPALATWKQVNPRHYRFFLNAGPGRTFHDGTRLTAYDVKATYESILDPTQASPLRGSLQVIDRIEARSDEIIDFYLTQPDPLFPRLLGVGILPRRLLVQRHPFHARPVGSGPFAFQAKPDDNRLQLVRVQDGRRFEFLRIPDPTVRALKLLAGEIDMVQNDLPPEIVSYLARTPALRIQRIPGTTFTYLGFNLRDPVTRHLALRQAIAYAIDREAIIASILGGAARLAHSILPPYHWAGHPALQGYRYDPEKARSLLAGLDKNVSRSLTYKTSSDPFRLRVATIIQDQLAKIGLHVEVRSYDWGTFYGDIKAGRFQLYSLSWVGVKTPDIFSYAFHSRSIPPHGANRGRYHSPLADRLIEEAEAAQSLEEKQKLYRRLQEHLLATLPYVPLWYEDHVFVARKEIQGYVMAPDGNYDGLQQVYRSVRAVQE
ncbi:MAG: ABC transporter substrate-binding protein [Nitrospirae bacterium]|nr:MAG: ABC transporter substrate-binding protein [Nitrospirota bacterium]